MRRFGQVIVLSAASSKRRSWQRGPGLSVKLDEEVIREHPQQKIFFNLFAEN